VVERDWDTLVILDACRADDFDAVVVDQLPSAATRETVRSPASMTREWMEKTFGDRTLGDTVYVSANPWITKVAPESFHAVHNLWIEEEGIDESAIHQGNVLADAGVDLVETIPAETVTEFALEMAQRYPDKRLIVHYMQPHAPYVGRSDGTRRDPSEMDPEIHLGRPIVEGTTAVETVRSRYRENLEYVWHHASELVAKLEGKTVVSSDHGDLFGERLYPVPLKIYGHPRGVPHPNVRTVPWVEFPADSRRRVVDDGVQSGDHDGSAMDDHLRHLGYKL
jgi:hypothetical protein